MKKPPTPAAALASVHLRRTASGLPLARVRIVTASAITWRTYRPEYLPIDHLDLIRQALCSAGIATAWASVPLPSGPAHASQDGSADTQPTRSREVRRKEE